MLDAGLVQQQHAALADLRLVEGLAQVAYRRKTDVASGEPNLPFGLRAGLEHALQEIYQRLLVRAGPALGEFHQVEPAPLAEEVADELDFLCAEHHVPAILGAVGAIERRAAPAALVLRHRRALLGEHRPEHVWKAGQQRVEHRDIEVVAPTGLLAAIERHGDAAEPHEGGGNVGGRDERHDRLAVVAEVDADRAGIGLDRQVVRRQVAARAGLAEGADRGVDDPRVHRRDGRVVHAEPLDHAGAERFDEHVGRLGQREQCRALVRVLEVQHHALLAAVHVPEERGVPALFQPDVPAGIALAGRLDLDHLGAVVRHHHREQRPGQELRQVEDPDPLELHSAPAWRSRSMPAAS